MKIFSLLALLIVFGILAYLLYIAVEGRRSEITIIQKDKVYQLGGEPRITVQAERLLPKNVKYICNLSPYSDFSDTNHLNAEFVTGIKASDTLPLAEGKAVFLYLDGNGSYIGRDQLNEYTGLLRWSSVPGAGFIYCSDISDSEFIIESEQGYQEISLAM